MLKYQPGNLFLITLIEVNFMQTRAWQISSLSFQIQRWRAYNRSRLIAGSLAHSVSDPYVALAGASGGCYALIGAHVATIIMVSDLHFAVYGTSRQAVRPIVCRHQAYTSLRSPKAVV